MSDLYPEIYTIQDLMKIFKVRDQRTIRGWIEEQMFPNAKKIKGCWYVPKADVDWIFSKDTNEDPPEAATGQSRGRHKGEVRSPYLS